MKLKIGDQVTIRKDLKNDTLYGKEYYYVKEMGKHLGKTATIVSHSRGTYEIDLDDGDWIWTEEMFEPKRKYKKRVKNKFKLGQNVRVIKCPIAHFSSHDGKVGVVEKVYRGVLRIKLSNGDICIPDRYESLTTRKPSVHTKEYMLKKFNNTFGSKPTSLLDLPAGTILVDKKGNYRKVVRSLKALRLTYYQSSLEDEFEEDISTAWTLEAMDEEGMKVFTPPVEKKYKLKAKIYTKSELEKIINV